MICSHCGKELNDGTPVCIYCGTRLAQSSAPVSEQSNAPAQTQNSAPVFKDKSANSNTNGVLSLVFSILAFLFDFTFLFFESIPRFLIIFPLGLTIAAILLAASDLNRRRSHNQPLSVLSLIGLGIAIAIAAQLLLTMFYNIFFAFASIFA